MHVLILLTVGVQHKFIIYVTGMNGVNGATFIKAQMSESIHTLNMYNGGSLI